MSTETDRHNSVEAAMSEVLGAERDALARIAACEDRADQILREARQAVRAMVRRTRQRTSRLHANSAARTRELVAAMEQDAGLESEPLDDRDQQRLEAAVSEVARDLTLLDESDAD